jgi:hypothetical protein
MSTITTNKSLTEPAIGDTGWGVTTNTNLTILDTALGGNTTLNATGASGTVTLSAAQYQSLYFIVTGTLTANVTYSLPSGVGGQWVVYNGSSGSFTVTFASAGGGTSYAVPQGIRTLIVSDGTNVSLSINNIGTVSGTVGVSNGGTGQTSLPSQNVLIGNGTYGVLSVAPSTANNVLTSNGTSWSSASLASQFASTTGATGSITMPGGVIMKWGSGGAPSGSGSVTFTTPFPAACDNVMITISGATTPITVNPLIVGASSTTGFAVWGDAAQSNGFYWFAIGH